jgi:hypothetical protein
MPALALDRSRSPRTGWTRDHWVRLLATLSGAFADAAETSGSPARPRLAGSDGGLVPGLEGFARMSVAWGAWLGLASNPTTLGAPEGRVDVERLHAQGLLDGTERGGRWWWGEMEDRDQRIVEAAEIATGLWLGGKRLVPALGSEGLRQVLGWLDGVHGRETYDDNWVLFPAVVATVQRSFGWAVPDAAIDAGVDTMLARYRGDGWYTDGPGAAFDAYTGWAVHWDLLLWARIDGDRRPRVRSLVRRRARTYLRSIVPQFAADGSRPLFGRSLGYRFAAAALFALAALLDLDAIPPGLARRIASGTIAHHLDLGALDPETGWLRRGVGAERPSVCERYVSAGAAAWAAHVFVALGLPADAPFWSSPEEPLPVELGDGVRAIRGPGFLIGWRKASGETWLANGLSGHPDDIPGHDYRPYYGKLTYRSHHPFDVRASTGELTADDVVQFRGRSQLGQRSETDRGGAGPGWTWSAYRVPGPIGSHRAVTVVLPWRTIEVRATWVRPAGPLTLVEGSAPLPVDDAEQVVRRSSEPGRWASSESGGRAVAIRAIVGYDRVVPGGTGPSDENLVADRVEHPFVEESPASARARIVLSASAAAASDSTYRADLDAIDAKVLAGSVVLVRLGDEESCLLQLGPRTAGEVVVAGRRVTGPGVRVVRARMDGSAFAGEAISAIDGVVELDPPGPLSVQRLETGIVRATTASGIRLDPSWMIASPRRATLDGGLGTPIDIPLDEPGVIGRRAIRRLQRITGATLLELELRP